MTKEELIKELEESIKFPRYTHENIERLIGKLKEEEEPPPFDSVREW